MEYDLSKLDRLDGLGGKRRLNNPSRDHAPRDHEMWFQYRPPRRARRLGGGYLLGIAVVIALILCLGLQ